MQYRFNIGIIETYNNSRHIYQFPKKIYASLNTSTLPTIQLVTNVRFQPQPRSDFTTIHRGPKLPAPLTSGSSQSNFKNTYMSDKLSLRRRRRIVTLDQTANCINRTTYHSRRSVTLDQMSLDEISDPRRE